MPVQPRAAGQPHLATDRQAAWLRLWTTVLGLAFLAGQPLPAPPPETRAAAAGQPGRTDHMVASLAGRLAAERGVALRGCYPPAALARALARTGKRLLAGGMVPARAGQVWVIPQLRWAYEAARVGWERDGVRPDDLAPPLDFALAGLPDWPGILAGERLALLLRHPVALTAPANRALASTALFGADGRAAFARALTADLALAFPAAGLSWGAGTAVRSGTAGGAGVFRRGSAARSPGGALRRCAAGSPAVVPRTNPVSRTDNAVSPVSRPHPAVLAEAMRVMDCPADWLIAFLR